ncbi:uncharacterized protein LODBEIA_P10000 [Lodderomyces beijingensis]|uniref:Chloride channel protein n=1 Tax=Lodderomyces beijingensis TaxID=1775926 RepID=A0ABP0ZF35_9ASCO
MSAEDHVPEFNIENHAEGDANAESINVDTYNQRMKLERGPSFLQHRTTSASSQWQQQHHHHQLPSSRLKSTRSFETEFSGLTLSLTNSGSAAHERKFARTVPSTPMIHEDLESPLLAAKHSLNIRSQIFRKSLVSPPHRRFSKVGDDEAVGGVSDINDDDDDEYTSLRSSRTHESSNSNSNSQFLLASPMSHLPIIQTIRDFYNDFTTIDWTKAYLKGNQFNYSLEKNRWIGVENVDDDDDNYEEKIANSSIPFLQKQYFILGKWILIVFVGLFFSIIAFVIDKFELLLVGVKHGYCKTNWFASQVTCCANADNSKHSGSFNQDTCPQWISWSNYFENLWISQHIRVDYLIYVVLSVTLASLACLVTLTTKITGGAVDDDDGNGGNTKGFTSGDASKANKRDHVNRTKPRVIYTANGSGVPEVKTILSGFVIRRFLGVYTLCAKTIALIFAIASGMSLGKEGPYVHLATCVGNITSRYFPFIYKNDLFEKQILSASASAGVALAFGSPLGGVLFILEEINNYLPSHQLFQVFFCAIISTLFLKFLNPYGTGKTVLFELEYYSDWYPLELLFFVFIGISGGIFGAAFVKFVNWWPKKFRSLKYIKDKPLFEVFLVATITGLVTFWNPYTIQASTELVLDLATSCSGRELDRSLCPTTKEQFVREIGSLMVALIMKIVLTFITFGLKLPCGIYVPSMVAGALYGRVFAMSIRYLGLLFKDATEMSTATCMPSSIYCVDMGIYAMISAGAFMAGVTRMNITIVTILFELTSSYTYVLPIAVAIAVANWAGGLIEKNSLYESLLVANDYPFMSPETEPIDPRVMAIDIVSADLIPSKRSSFHASTAKDLIDANSKIFIDLTDSNMVSIEILQQKLVMLADRCLLDGCIPLVKNQVCVGLLNFSELEICLDRIESFVQEYGVRSDNIQCKLMQISGQYSFKNKVVQQNSHAQDYFSYGSTMQVEDQEEEEEEGEEEEEVREGGDFDLGCALDELTDLTKYVDRKPIFINHDNELSFAHLIFDRIGTRVVVLLKNGKYYGVLHKKVLIDYLRRVESGSH